MEHLTVEEIKKIFDNFEVQGFSLKSKDLYFIDTFMCDEHSSHDLYHDMAYPLFLQRVIDGINRDFLKSEIKDYYIQMDTHIMIMDRMGIPRHDFKAKEVNDNNKTKAIKYILEQL